METIFDKFPGKVINFSGNDTSGWIVYPERLTPEELKEVEAWEQKQHAAWRTMVAKMDGEN